MISKPFVLTIFFLVVMVVVPVSAYTYSFPGVEGKAISILTIESPIDTEGTFELFQDDGTTISGSWSYLSSVPLVMPYQASATIGSSSTSFTYITPGSLTLMIYPTSNVTNSNSVRLGIGQTSYSNAVIETTMNPSPIVGYSITSDNEVETNEVLVPITLAAKSLTEGDKSADQLWTTFSVIYGTIEGMIYWLKFLFVDNLILVVTLYFTGTMAYAANTSSNIFKFYKTWFRQQASFFRFLAEMVSTVYTLIIQAFNAVTKWF